MSRMRFLLVSLCVAFFAVASLAFILPYVVFGERIEHFSDTISDSAPEEYSNHTISFIAKDAIPPGGTIRIRPEPGEFEIPASVDFDIDNVELLVNSIARNASATPNSTADGVAITTGLSGQVEVTLNSTVGIPAGAEVQLKIGSHTSHSTSTDLGILNPTDVRTYPIYIETGDEMQDQFAARIAIIENVGVGPVDTRETQPPFRFNGAPMGDLSGTTQTVELSLRTDEFAKCRYSVASGTPYFSMGNEFSTTFTVVHAILIPVATSTSYAFYVRCIDDEGNANPDDYLIAFRVLDYPTGTPGDTGDDQGNGDGEGDSDQGGTGDSSGDTGGSPNSGGGSGGNTSGGGSGGSGGGGSQDGGGLEGSPKPYQSGEGELIINGYAFPNSIVTILVDGKISDTTKANTNGVFSITIDAIARGVYTFGIYATDKDGLKSSTFSTSFLITGARGSTLSNINVMPTVSVSPDPVTPGGKLLIKGYSIPNATVTIETQNEKSSVSLKTFTAVSDGSGKWQYEADTTGFSAGTYKVRAKAKQEQGASTNWSGYSFYGVGQSANKPLNTDLNRDSKVNLVDFSILLFWWNSAGGNSNPPADINQDGKVSLTDFSILIFNWTG